MKAAGMGLGVVLAMAASSVMAQEAAAVAETVSLTPLSWWIAPFGAVFGLFFAWVCYKLMMGAPKGNARMEEIAGYVREGAMAYLKQQYTRVGMVFIVLVAIFTILAIFKVQNPFVPVAFLTGGFFSGLCGFLGMKTATAASSRTAQGASESLNRGLQVAFRSGAVMGLVVVGFGLLDITLWYLILDKLVYTTEHMQNGLWVLVPAGFDPSNKMMEITTTMLTFGMGASTQALFARVGGGIFTKAADVGADLVGKVEAGIPEDDPRNPATIADNVGDNVGDVAGMGADLYESYCGAILATAALGAALPGLTANVRVGYVTAPMIIAGIGTILSVAGIFAVRCKEGASMMTLLRALRIGTWGSSVLIVVVAALMAHFDIITWGVFGATIAGLLAGVLIGYSTEYYTSDEYGPTKGVATQAKMGPATVIIEGLAVGMMSAAIPVVVTVIAILASFILSGGLTNLSMGLYGIAFSAVGMLATLGITLATDAYGPIADNAGGNAEMSHLPPGVRERTDALDMLGNTTAATGKGFAIASAALTALALVAAALMEVDVWLHKMRDGLQMPFDFASYDQAAAAGQQIQNLVSQFNLTIMNPFLVGGAFIGAMMSFVFCAMTMKAVGRAAGAMVEEVRRQFRTKPGIMAGTDRPDYAMCVAISTKGAQREMMLPALLAIIVPVVTGLVLGIAGIMGLLIGALTAGFSLACMLNNAGGAWDNAKKHIEKGNFGGKKLADGSKNPIHSAAVIGDTVGDPCKDTSGPSMNILVKLMSMVAVVFMPVIIKFSPMIQKALHLVTP
jgi:K(+)-stimulated pyrophosphate-energized sodium pump